MCVQHDLNVGQCGQIYKGDFLSVARKYSNRIVSVWSTRNGDQNETMTLLFDPSKGIQTFECRRQSSQEFYV